MSLKSDWPEGSLFLSQLLHSTTINRGPHNSDSTTKNINKKLERARGSNAAISLQATSSRTSEDQVHQVSRSSPKALELKYKSGSSSRTSEDQDYQVQEQVKI